MSEGPAGGRLMCVHCGLPIGAYEPVDWLAPRELAGEGLSDAESKPLHRECAESLLGEEG